MRGRCTYGEHCAVMRVRLMRLSRELTASEMVRLRHYSREVDRLFPIFTRNERKALDRYDAKRKRITDDIDAIFSSLATEAP